MVLKTIFKTNTTKIYSKPTCVNSVYCGRHKPRKRKIKKQSKDNIIKNVRNLFGLKKENEAKVMLKSKIAVLLFKIFKKLFSIKGTDAIIKVFIFL